MDDLRKEEKPPTKPPRLIEIPLPSATNSFLKLHIKMERRVEEGKRETNGRGRRNEENKTTACLYRSPLFPFFLSANK